MTSERPSPREPMATIHSTQERGEKGFFENNILKIIDDFLKFEKA
jgi:hypothetical protein